MPSIAQDCDTKTTFCPQPSIPAPPSEGEDFGVSSRNLSFDLDAEVQAIGDLKLKTELPQTWDFSSRLHGADSSSPKPTLPSDQQPNNSNNQELNRSAGSSQRCELSKSCNPCIKPPCEQPCNPCEMPMPCAESSDEASNCCKSLQCPSIAEKCPLPSAKSKQLPCWTQCPSILEDPPYACFRKGERNSATQCPSQAVDLPRHSLPNDKTTSCRRPRKDSRRTLENYNITTAEAQNQVCARKVRSRRSQRRQLLESNSPCDPFGEAMHKSEVFKKFTPNCYEVKGTSRAVIEQSQLPDKMACNRNFATQPSTSCRGGESLTTLVQKAVESITNLKASVGDLKTVTKCET